MSKKIKKGLNIATFGLSGAAERLAFDPIKAGFSAAGMPIGGAAAPSSAAATAAPEAAPTALDPDVQAAREAQKKRQQAYAGLASTVLTRPGGLTGGANTQMKTLLGS